MDAQSTQVSTPVTRPAPASERTAGNKKKQKRNRYNHCFDVTHQSLADEWGITKQGVFSIERHLIRRLWLMGLKQHKGLKERAIYNFLLRNGVANR